MPILSPEQQAARIIAHYLKHLTLRTGLRWTSANDRDMAMLGELLGVEVETSDTIPAFDAPIVSDRQTVVLDRDDYERKQWGDFEAWRRQREEDAR